MALQLVKTEEFGTPVSSSLANEPARVSAEGITPRDFHYWYGKSGERYLHTVYSLFDCPEMPKANYILVRRDENGNRIPLKIGQMVEDSESLNLAFLRHHSACLGATEIHVHMLADADAHRTAIEHDLHITVYDHMVDHVLAQVANSQ